MSGTRFNWKKHTAIPAIVTAVVLLVAMAAEIRSRQDQGTFEWRDLIGSRDAIVDVSISGVLRDGYQSTHFQLDAGKLRTDTVIYQQPKYVDAYRYNPGSDKRIGDTEFSVQGFGTFKILSLKRKLYDTFFIADRTAQVAPTIHYGRDGNGDPVFANPLEYGVAMIGDKAFFTVPVSAQSTGSSGIYELNFYNWGNEPFVNVPKDYPPRLIAELDLKANESAEPPNIEVLGLEAVGDKLALISAENSELIIRGYDSSSGALLGEATVSDFRLQDSSASENSNDAAIAYSAAYEAFSDSENGSLNLGFRGSSGHRLMLSVDFRNGVRIANRVDADLSEEESEHLRDELSEIRYLNGKLYVIRTYRELRNADPEFVNEAWRPHQFYLYVYERSKLIYQGELLTDLNDDNGPTDYDQKAYRIFTDLSIE